MTTTATAPATSTAPRKDWTRGYARAAGIAYLVTFAASIPAVLLLSPLLNDPSYILTGTDDTRIGIACVLDLVNAVAAIATAVAVFPVVRRQNESLALGFVTSRVMEAATIVVGIVSLLAVVTLHQEVAGTAGADPASLQTAGQALVAVRDWTFVFGPDICAGMNALLFGTLLYRSRLVPRVIPTLGLIGGPLLLAASVLAIAGVVEPGSIWFAGVLPLATWEFSVGCYMAFRGFRPSPLTATAP
jgi:hypothetical protein